MQGGQEPLPQDFVNAPSGSPEDEADISAVNRLRRQARNRLAAKRLAESYTTSSLPEDLRFRIINPHGPTIRFYNPAQERAALMALTLHLTGKGLMMRKSYADALEFLYVSEEAFSGCTLDVLQIVDNFAILKIDIVWCILILRNIPLLSMAGVRLSAARNLLNCLHGEQLNFMRKHELAIYMRLDLLEGVVAYCNGDLEKARTLILSANQRCLELQASDNCVQEGMRFGYGEGEIRRALALYGGNILHAVASIRRERTTNPLPNPEFPYLNILLTQLQRNERTNKTEASSSQINQYHGSGSQDASSSQTVVLSLAEKVGVCLVESLILTMLPRVHILQSDITIQEAQAIIADYYAKVNRT